MRESRSPAKDVAESGDLSSSGRSRSADQVDDADYTAAAAADEEGEAERRRVFGEAVGRLGPTVHLLRPRRPTRWKRFGIGSKNLRGSQRKRWPV
jgi:hypothetical protein